MLTLADNYAHLLDANGAVISRAPLDQRLALPADRLIILNHARWQVEMVRQVAHRLGGESTAIRVLGSAQGLLMASGLVTVGEVWNANEKWLDGASIRAFETTKAELDEGHASGWT
jgi:hypothetical protein